MRLAVLFSKGVRCHAHVSFWFHVDRIAGRDRNHCDPQGAYNPHAVAGKIGQAAGDLVLIHAGTINSPSGRNLDDCASMHPGGANILFADGTVHFIHNISSGSVENTTFAAMGTIAGGEVFTTDLLN
jgi:prepilin-type processing-associated H-X9-DG protein